MTTATFQRWSGRVRGVPRGRRGKDRGRGAATCCRHGFLLLRFLKLELERVFGRTLPEWEALLLGQWVLFPGQAPRSDEGEAAGWSWPGGCGRRTRDRGGRADKTSW